MKRGRKGTTWNTVKGEGQLSAPLPQWRIDRKRLKLKKRKVAI